MPTNCLSSLGEFDGGCSPSLSNCKSLLTWICCHKWKLFDRICFVALFCKLVYKDYGMVYWVNNALFINLAVAEVYKTAQWCSVWFSVSFICWVVPEILLWNCLVFSSFRVIHWPSTAEWPRDSRGKVLEIVKIIPTFIQVSFCPEDFGSYSSEAGRNTSTVQLEYTWITILSCQCGLMALALEQYVQFLQLATTLGGK